jgi:hypothetical protein
MDTETTYTDMYGVVRSTEELKDDGTGKVVLTDAIENNLSRYRLIRTYLLSNYRINTLRNSDESSLSKIYAAIKSFFGGYQDAWCKGLIKLYLSENGVATKSWENDMIDEFGDFALGISITIDDKSLSIKRGRFKNAMVYNTEGWHARYGLSLEFLISLQLGTMAPDLVYAIVQNFDTEVQVYLNDMGASAVSSKYIDPNDKDSKEVTLEEISKVTDGLESYLVTSDHGSTLNSIKSFLAQVGLTKTQCMKILRNTGLESPDTCTGRELTYVVEADSSTNSINSTLNEDKNYLTEYYAYNDNPLNDVEYYKKGSSKDDFEKINAYNALNSARFLDSKTLFNDSNMNAIEEEKLTSKYESVGKNNEKEILKALKKSKISEYDEIEEELQNRTLSKITTDSTLYSIEGSEINREYDIYGYYDIDNKKFVYVTEEEAKTAENNGGYIDGHLVEQETIELGSYLYYVYVDASKILNDEDDEDANKTVVVIKTFTIGTEYNKVEIENEANNYGADLETKEYTVAFIKDNDTGEYSCKIFESFKGDGTDEDLVASGKARILEEYSSKDFFEILAGKFKGTKTTDFVIQIDEPVKAHVINGEIDNNTGKEARDEGNVQFKLSLEVGENYDLSWKEEEIGHYVNTGTIEAYKLTSKNKDSGPVLVDILWCNYVRRNRTAAELEAVGFKRGEQSKCSESADEKDTKCCTTCQNYVKSVVKALADIKDGDYKSYTPYIARVVGSWFRDTYFIVPQAGSDVAIDEYANGHDGRDGTTSYAVQHTDSFKKSSAEGTTVTFVKVDEEYLAESGEYWTSYEMSDDGSYQLYFLNADGTTSNTTLEQFLNCEVGSDENGNADNIPEHEKYSTQEDAEKDGWAFVKKAKTYSVTTVQNNENKGENILWSAYEFSSDGASTGWIRIDYNEDGKEGNEYVNKVYDLAYTKTDSEGNVDESVDAKEAANADSSHGFFYKLDSTNTVTQEEDANRGETNALIKYLFKYRKYYIYDGTTSKAVWVEHDKNRVLYGYNSYAEKYDTDGEYYKNKTLDGEVTGYTGNGSDFYKYQGVIPYLENRYGTGWATYVANEKLEYYGRSALRQVYKSITLVESYGETITDSEVDVAEQWLEWQLDMLYMSMYGVDLEAYYGTQEELLVLDYDPRDPDLISVVNITKSSLNAFDILESTGTLDAEYQLRDFKELIVELNYFDKEDLSSKISSVFTWILPEISSAGWPKRPYDKQDVDYGALIESKNTYKGLEESGNSESDTDNNDDTESTDSTDGTDGTTDTTDNTNTNANNTNTEENTSSSSESTKTTTVISNTTEMSYEVFDHATSVEHSDVTISAYGTKFYQFCQHDSYYSNVSLNSVRTDKSSSTLDGS